MIAPPFIVPSFLEKEPGPSVPPIAAALGVRTLAPDKPV